LRARLPFFSTACGAVSCSWALARAGGMVFTIEPGIYIREENMGIRIENDFVIGKDSNFDLMGKIPIEVEEIEALMNA
jgi:Xaa-Pro aminopeptidase